MNHFLMLQSISVCCSFWCAYLDHQREYSIIHTAILQHLYVYVCAHKSKQKKLAE